MAKTGLGKGLSALIPDGDEQESPFQNLPIGEIRPNRYQPREQFDSEEMRVLSDSIKRIGILQPLIVRSDGTGYELIAGERRLRAAHNAGLDFVPVIVKDASDEASLEQALLENVHRADLNPLEEAAAYRQLIDDFGLTHETVAQRVGKSRAAVSNTLRLLGLPDPIQEMLTSGELSGGHARALLGITGADEQTALANQIVDQGLSVRATEALIRAETPANGDNAPSKSPTHPALLEVGDLMGEYLCTGVQVKLGRGSGKLVIEFGDLADLERISNLIVTTENQEP